MLDDAIEWCKKRGVEFYAVNKNFPEEVISEGNCYGKINADLFIDDRNLGGIPDWGVIYKMIIENKDWSEIYKEQPESDRPKKKKGWFW